MKKNINVSEMTREEIVLELDSISKQMNSTDLRIAKLESKGVFDDSLYELSDNLMNRRDELQKKLDDMDR